MAEFRRAMQAAGIRGQQRCGRQHKYADSEDEWTAISGHREGARQSRIGSNAMRGKTAKFSHKPAVQINLVGVIKVVRHLQRQGRLAILKVDLQPVPSVAGSALIAPRGPSWNIPTV